MSLYDLVRKGEATNNTLFEAIKDLTVARRFPLHATFELSPVCNFSCPFCYARVSMEELQKRGERILRFRDWKRFIDEACEMGTYRIALTGGECMLHPDFKEIYRYAYEQGCDLSLLTNGSCVTPEIISLLKECPPNGVFLTLYGASPETYEKVCGSAAFYEKVYSAVRSIKEIGIQLVLQFTVGKDNEQEMKSVYDFAKDFGVPVRFSVADLAYRRSTPEVLDECAADRLKLSSVSKEIYKDMHDMTDEEFVVKGKQPINIIKKPVVEKGMPCGGGRNSFAINYRGEMIPCIVFDAIKIPTENTSLSDSWSKLTKACDEVPRLTECTNCIFKSHCKHCIALHYNYTKEFGKPAPHICFKQLYPERAKEIEARYKTTGLLCWDDLQ